MSTWVFVAALGGMAAVGMVGAVALTPKRHPGRHIPNPAALREESGADETYAVELAVMRDEIEEGPQPEPNYYRSDEYPLVRRSAGDTQEWEVQERVVEPEPADWVPAEVIEEEPEPSPWMRVALDDEPTPLAPGPVPALERWETFTEGWVRKPRAELLEELRSGEYELAKGDQAA